MTQINWRAVWREFDRACEKRQENPFDYPEWPEQKRMIQAIVQRHIKGAQE